MSQSLTIKDGNGNLKNLMVESGSTGYISVHAISSSAGSGTYVTASAAYPIYVTGNVSVNTASLITVTASSAAPVYVTGTVSVNTASLMTVTASSASPVYVTGAIVSNILPVTAASQAPISSFSWGTSASGTFQIAANNQSRKGLAVFNPGPNNLYVALSNTGGTTNGFSLTSINSPPSSYSFILYPSGTFLADSTNVGVCYGGYFISGSASSGVFITETL